MTYTITLDISHEVTLGQLDEILESHSATITQYNPFGPAGGNPEITFSFPTKDDLTNFVAQIYEIEDSDELRYYTESAEMIS